MRWSPHRGEVLWKAELGLPILFSSPLSALVAVVRTDISANPGSASKLIFENQIVPHGHASHERASDRQVSLIGVSLFLGDTLHGHVSHRRLSHKRASHGHAPHGDTLMGMHLTGVYLTGHVSHRRVPYLLHRGHLVQSYQYLA